MTTPPRDSLAERLRNAFYEKEEPFNPTWVSWLRVADVALAEVAAVAKERDRAREDYGGALGTIKETAGVLYELCPDRDALALPDHARVVVMHLKRERDEAVALLRQARRYLTEHACSALTASIDAFLQPPVPAAGAHD